MMRTMENQEVSDEEVELTVEKILDRRLRKGRVEYLLKFKESNEFIWDSHIHDWDLIENFENERKRKASAIKPFNVNENDAKRPRCRIHGQNLNLRSSGGNPSGMEVYFIQWRQAGERHVFPALILSYSKKQAATPVNDSTVPSPNTATTSDATSSSDGDGDSSSASEDDSSSSDNEN